MRISFQILHSYQNDLLKIIGKSIHLTLQDDLYNEIDLEKALNFVSIKLNKQLQSGEQICYFEIEIDQNTYDLTNYDALIDGFTNRLRQENGFFKLIKYVDELRLETYINIYLEIADIEMRIREVFSYIFYSKYDDKNQDIFEEFEVQIINKEDVRSEELVRRLENKFFYLTFKQYLKFDTPKDIPTKEVLPLIMSNQTYDLLREYVSSRGIIEQRHLSFLRNVSRLLDPIENVRNCIAHNRKIPINQLDNYPNAKGEILAFIDNFWQEEIEELTAENEINFAEQYSYDRLKELLDVAEWQDYNNAVVLHDFWQTGTPTTTFNSLVDFKAHLLDIANETASANFPSNGDDRETYEQLYNGEVLVNKVLTEYKRQLIVMDWI